MSNIPARQEIDLSHVFIWSDNALEYPYTDWEGKQRKLKIKKSRIYARFAKGEIYNLHAQKDEYMYSFQNPGFDIHRGVREPYKAPFTVAVFENNDSTPFMGYNIPKVKNSVFGPRLVPIRININGEEKKTVLPKPKETIHIDIPGNKKKMHLTVTEVKQNGSVTGYRLKLSAKSSKKNKKRNHGLDEKTIAEAIRYLTRVGKQVLTLEHIQHVEQMLSGHQKSNEKKNDEKPKPSGGTMETTAPIAYRDSRYYTDFNESESDSD